METPDLIYVVVMPCKATNGKRLPAFACISITEAETLVADWANEEDPDVRLDRGIFKVPLLGTDHPSRIDLMEEAGMHIKKSSFLIGKVLQEELDGLKIAKSLPGLIQRKLHLEAAGAQALRDRAGSLQQELEALRTSVLFWPAREYKQGTYAAG